MQIGYCTQLLEVNLSMLRSIIIRRLRLFVAVIALTPFSCLLAFAQTTSQYDRGTPPQLATGVSTLGSYLSADLGVINLSNGALNINLPIGKVGGRGLSIPILLNFDSKLWSARTGTQQVNDPQVHIETYAAAVYGVSGNR